MRRLFICLALSTALASAGCSLYFGGDDDDDICTFGGDAPQPGTPAGYVNPTTGECEYFGGGGGWCDPRCDSACASEGAVADEAVAQPSWAMCESSCTGLDEQTCLDTPGCRAGYVDECSTGGCAPQFRECWATDQTGPVQGGTCEGLDAWECSRHDDCIAVHSGCASDPAGNADRIACPIGNFDRCAAEPTTPDNGCFGDSDCKADERCNAAEVCLPAPGCGGSNPTDPNGGEGLVPCPDVCYGECVPRVTDPGECYTEALCDMITPACPTGSLPGVKDGCYTGYCIPVAECPDMPPACETVTSEATCIARVECTGLYEGVGCTCDPSGCVCDEWVFQSCTTP